MKPEQLSLFDAYQPALEHSADPPNLNGFYYEQVSNKFVSFVLGRRHFEIHAKNCGARYPKDWREMLKREREI